MQAELEEEGEQLRPPGFVMIRLPWAEEIRKLSVSPHFLFSHNKRITNACCMHEAIRPSVAADMNLMAIDREREIEIEIEIEI